MGGTGSLVRARKHESWFQRNPRKTILCICGAFFLILDSLTASILLPQHAIHLSPRCHHALWPNLNMIDTWGTFRYRLRTNSLGFKDAGHTKVALDAGRPRVLLIGDSFTEGIGVPYEETFAGMAASALANDGIEVLNAGIRSHSPKLHYLRIKRLLAQGLRFDMLYVFVDVSDAHDENAYASFFPYEEPKLRRLDNWLKRRSYVYETMRSHVISGGNIRAILSIGRHSGPDAAAKMRGRRTVEGWRKLGLNLGAQNMDRLLHLCERRGVTMVIAVYPWPRHILQKDTECLYATFWRRFARERGVRCLDYFPDFITEEAPHEVVDRCFLRGDVHWNRAGHEIVAARLVRHIRAVARMRGH